MIEGYILLPKESNYGYYGIDRGFFEPLLIESEFEEYIPGKKYTTVSSCFPPGWRKTAYELYEGNQILVDDTFGILKDYETASQIQHIINPYLGEYQIFLVQITGQIADFQEPQPCYGYDFAYRGGDYFSAIKNGLFVNRSETLYAKFGSYLNEHGMFNDPFLFEDYIREFKKEVLSEADSTFWVYRLTKK